LAGDWSTKLHYRHLSSHPGDEFIERTGRRRIGYTREDFTLGVAWEPLPGATVYGEGGVGIHDGAGRKDAVYFQFGAQNGDDDPGITVQGALLVPLARPGQQFRLALEFHTGCVLIGESSEFNENYLALILAWDF
jgi:hypothetical protein